MGRRLDEASRNIVPFAIAFIIFVPVLLYLFPYNASDSMPKGIYMRLPRWDVEEGDLVQAVNPMRAGYLGVYASDNLLKRVVRIEDGYYTLRGESAASFDSRFFGSLSRDFIVSELVPVLIFE